MPHSTTDHSRTPRWQWWLVVLSGALTLICGTIGVAQYEREHLGHVHGLSPLYHAAQMLILHTPHFEKGWNLWIEVGRWFGVLTLFGATLAILWARFRREIMLFRIGTWSNHSVICGLGRKGFELARCLKRRAGDNRVVVIDPDPDPELAAQCAENRIGAIAGDAATPRTLKLAGATRARQISSNRLSLDRFNVSAISPTRPGTPDLVPPEMTVPLNGRRASVSGSRHASRMPPGMLTAPPAMTRTGPTSTLRAAGIEGLVGSVPLAQFFAALARSRKSLACRACWERGRP
jgi:hypothetical protein